MEKKKKQLGYRSLIPTIIGFVFSILGIIFVPIIIKDLFEYQTMQTSLIKGEKDASSVIEYFVEAESEEDKINQFNSINSLNKNIENIFILDNNRNILSSYGSTTDISNIKEITDFTGENEIDIKMYFLSSNSNSISLNKKNDLNINLFKSGTVVLSKITDENYKFTDNIINYNVIFEKEINGNIILVNEKIEVFSIDIIWSISAILIVLIIEFFIIIGLFIRIIKEILNRRRIKKALYYNSITEGYNYDYFKEKTRKIITKKKNKKNPINYAIIDLTLEKYRSYVLCYGSEKANLLLQRINKYINSMLKNKEIAVLKEKSNFAILMENNDNLATRDRITNIIYNIKEQESDTPLDFSAGICEVVDEKYEIDDLYNNACIARGNSTDEVKVMMFEIDMENEKKWEIEIEADMNKALQNEEFKVYLQAKYSPDHVLGGAEALVRWIHPEKGFISPGKFIPLFEKNGFITKLDDYMLEHVCMYQAKWYRQGKKIVPISVNVSRAHFTRSDLAKHITAIVDKYKIPRHSIELELTESSFFDDKKTLINTVKQLKKKGFMISMDDFGAGYSSLNSLKELDIDVLKLDAGFFDGKDNNEKRDIIVSEAIHLAKKLNMKIVAEGIEKEKQLAILKELKCDLIQGYIFAKPIPAEEYEANVLTEKEK